MPINTNLSTAPYFDDFDIEKQYYRVLFKPAYAVQARELTQLQSVLQNQIEQFGDNIFKEGSIIKGCTFTELNDLNYVKLSDKIGFDPLSYVGFTDTTTISGQEYERDNSYELRGSVSGVTAVVVAAARGFETRNPDLNTFFINYTNTSAGNKLFQSGELLSIYKISVVEVGTSINRSEELVETINVTTFPNPVGNSFGLRSAPGIIFQKGHFLFADEQLVIVSKYTNQPDNVSVGYNVQERLITSLQDSSLYDNANGFENENAPGADRLKLTPVLVAIPTPQADADTTFFTLTRYSNGSAVVLRDVSQYNVLGDEMARRTYEESGDYIVRDFKTKVIRRNGNLAAAVSTGLAYVKGFRVESVGEQFLPIDPIANNAVETRINQAVSFNYGSYLNFLDTATAGTVAIDDFSTVNLQDGSTSNIGTARVRNVTSDKIYLFDIRINSNNTIADVNRVVGDSGYLSVANNSIVREASSGSMIFTTGMISLKSTENISLPVRERRELSSLTSNTVTISPAVGEDFNVNNDDILFVDSTNTKLDPLSVSLSGSDLVVELDGTPAADATIYLNKRILDARPFTKVSAELYVKCTFASADSTSATKFNLGFPDVYEIVSITDSANNDVTSSFRLRSNQKDNYYDLSYIEFISGRPIPADGAMTVRMNAFKLNDTTGEYFFTVDSYEGVDKNKLQPYTSASGRTYSLRDCLDFRPLVEPISGANYTNAASVGTAPTVSSSSTGVNLAPVFSASYSILTPAANEYGELDYDFYLNRTDIITLDSFGKTFIVKGTESEFSRPPAVTGDQIKIAEIYVPGVPALSPEEAAAQSRPQYGVKITSKGTKSYTMQDIENLEKKIDAIKYYVLLNSIESATQNLNIIDENGFSRFKNGFIVDPFNDLSIANLENTEFNAAIDFTEKSLMPAVKTFPINLRYKSSTAASIFPSTSDARIATVARNQDIAIISQPYATEFRNCVSNFYSYRGVGALFPEYDSTYDVTTNPVAINIDLASPFQQFADTINEFVPLTSTSSAIVGSRSSVNETNAANGGTDVTTTTTSRIRTTTRSLSVSSTVSEQNVGDFVTNINFNPYMSARDVNVYMSGLRPNTRHYFFFDGVDVNQFVSPGSPANTARTIRRNGNLGAAISSDSNGVVRAVFSLPAETFFVGDRKLEVVDVDDYSAIGSASTSRGFLTYRAYNFSLEKSALTVSTRIPEVAVNTSTSDRSVTRRSTTNIPPAQPPAQPPTVNVPPATPPNPAQAFVFVEDRSCFVAGTLVTMADGSKKRIEEILIGEKLLGQDGSINTVIGYDHPMLNGRDLIAFNGSKPFMTPEHPLWTKKGWKSWSAELTQWQKPMIAHLMVNGDFEVGDEILMDDGTWFTIESIEVHSGEPQQQVFNFFLDGNHTYFADGLLAHNRDYNDPIAQTFFIKNGMGQGSDTVFASKLDIYFKRKSNINGVTVELREVINGYPSYYVIPFSKTHFTPAEVLTSDDASIATVVTFQAPVRLDVEKEYCFVVIPDAADPDYLIFTSKVGGTDLTPGANQGRPIVQDWGDGVLFTSTNNRAWKSYQDEDVKFNLYRHNFNESFGNVTLVDNDHEFITTENNIGRFKTGELVYTLESRDASTANTVSVVSGNNQITGTNLSVTYAAGDYILLDDGSTNKQVFEVVSANSTVIVADRPASFTDAVIAHPVTLGTLRHYDFRYPNFIVLEESSATSTRKFTASDTIYGFDSDAQATITSVDNIEFSYIQPMISRTNDSVTSTALSGSFVDPNNTSNRYSLPMEFNDKTIFSKNGMVVFSKSNDISRTRGMELTVSMANGGNVTSTPFIDIETSAVLAYQWKITNSSETTSKYISKTVELAEDLDAEDMRVFVTGYRPNGTNIKVYIKPQAADDAATFETNDWIELQLTNGVNTYSSISNYNDFREFVYNVSETNKTGGVLSYTNDLGTHNGYRRFAIKIELLSENIFKAPRLLDYRGIALT